MRSEIGAVHPSGVREAFPGLTDKMAIDSAQRAAQTREHGKQILDYYQHKNAGRRGER